MRAAGPAAGAAFTVEDVALKALEVVGARLGLFNNGYIANPLIAGEGSESVP